MARSGGRTYARTRSFGRDSHVKIREAKGAEKRAACGQLGNVRLRKEIRERERAANEAADGRTGGRASPAGCRDGSECVCGKSKRTHPPDVDEGDVHRRDDAGEQHLLSW